MNSWNGYANDIERVNVESILYETSSAVQRCRNASGSASAALQNRALLQLLIFAAESSA